MSPIADGITLPTTGTGTSTPKVATDDAGSPGHVQIIKLAISTDGSAAVIPADATNGLSVDVTRIAAGSNAIGKLAANSGVNIGTIDVATMPGAAPGTDGIGAFHATNSIMNGTTALTPKFVIIDAASAGDNTILAAVSAKIIRVLSLFLVNGHTATQTVRFESGAGGTALTGQMILGANGGFVLPFNPIGWFQTASNTLLNLELAGATTVDGGLAYVEV